MKDSHGIKGVKRLLGIQLLTSLLIALVLFFVSGKKEAISALLGGIIAIVPSAVFAIKLFQYQGAKAARQIIKGFYSGEALKITLSGTLFTMVFLWVKIIPFIFFLTYIVVLLNYWFAPLIFANKQNRPESD